MNNLDYYADLRGFKFLLEKRGVSEITGFLGEYIRKSPGNKSSILKGLQEVYSDFDSENLCDWFDRTIKALVNEDFDTQELEGSKLLEKEGVKKSLLAELEAYGQLKSLFGTTASPIQVRKNAKTPDFSVNNEILIEVYCPDESHPEADKVHSELNKQTGCIKSTISRPVTGPSDNALAYPANQVMAKILGSKREHNQFEKGKKNILWLDLKYKLGLKADDCLPIRSLVAKGHTFVGCFGVWHAFYGEVDTSFIPHERFVIKYETGRESNNYYKQHKYTGLFRDREDISAAIVSCVDGNLIFLNPWCTTELSNKDIRNFMSMSRFRPEFSFFVKETLLQDIESKLLMIEKVILGPES